MTQTTAVELPAKLRLRVKAHGEVLTPRRMVDQMLDLVHDDLKTGRASPIRRSSNQRRAIVTVSLRSSSGDSRKLISSISGIAGLTSLCLPLPRSMESSYWRTTIRTPKAAMPQEFLHFCASRGFTCGPHVMVGDIGRATSGARIPSRPAWPHQSPADVFENGVV